MGEIQNFQGKLALKKQDLMVLGLRMQGVVLGLRELLDPTIPVDELQTDIIADHALMLATLHADYKAIQEEIKTIKRALG